MKKLLLLLVSVFLFQGLYAQDETPKFPKTPIGGRPNIPADLNLEFGFNQLSNRSEALAVNFFQSRTFNVNLQYPLNLFGDASGFVLKPGIGIGTDKMAFQEDRNLFNDPDRGAESSQLLEVREVYGERIVINKNTFSANYVEIPVDIVYHFNKSNYNTGFSMSVGGKVGFLYDAHSKIRYEDGNGLKRQVKDRQNYGLEKIRYGITVKAGTPGFYGWGYFGLNQVFQENLGPFGSEATQINFGVAVTVF